MQMINPASAARPDLHPIRPDVVRRVEAQLAAGTYRPPVDRVVDRLLAALAPGSRPLA